jgi:hypothetical protein
MLKELLNPSRKILKLGAKLLEEHDISNNQTNNLCLEEGSLIAAFPNS